MNFSESVKWIYDKNAEVRQWYVLRSTFTADAADTVLKIASMGEYEVYINGEFVLRGPTRSYKFYRVIDAADISKFIHSGTNTIAVLSMYLERGGTAAQIDACGRCLLKTDESWKVKKYDAIIDDTYECSPPLEPMRRNEENIDARKDIDVLGRDFDDSDWCCADDMGYSDITYADCDGSCLTDDFVLPKAILAITGVRNRNGVGFRLKNKHRIKNPVTMGHAEAYAGIILSNENKSYGLICESCKVYINGKETGNKAELQKGRNFICCISTDAITEPELFFEGLQNIDFEDILYRGTHVKWLVTSFETSEKCYGWAYTYDPFLGNDTKRRLDSIKKATSVDEFVSITGQTTNEAAICNNSARFSLATDEYMYSDNGFSDPALKLKFVDEKSDIIIRNYQSILHNNSDNATIENGDAKVIFDFGQEVFGYINFEVYARRNTVIETESFEMIDGQGIRHNNLECMRYICREGWQNFTAHLPRGMRYLSFTVKNIHDTFKINHIGIRHSVAAVVHRGAFECDDEMYNRIYSMCVRTVQECMNDTYVDCPGFEQVYWLGDAKVPAEVNMLNFGGYDYDYKCLMVAAQSLTLQYKCLYRNDDENYKNDKYLVTPAYGSYVYGGLPIWSFMWLYQVYHNYMYSGNREHIKNLFPYTQKMLENCENMIDDRGLFVMSGVWGLIEWADNDIDPCCELTSNSAWLSFLYQCFAKVAEDLGKIELTKKYYDIAKALNKAINQYCWNDKMNAYVDTVRDEYGYKLYKSFFEKNRMPAKSFDEFKALERISEQTNTIVYLCGCVPKEREKYVTDVTCRIKAEDYPHKRGNPNNNLMSKEHNINEIVSIGSPFFFYYTFGALAKMGSYELLLDVIKREYSYMLSYGTNTCWEEFPQPEVGVITRSVCHAWGASPAIYLLTDIAGIKPVEPGFKKFSFEPHLCGLKYVKATVPTPYGNIYVHIDRDKNIKEIIKPEECFVIQNEMTGVISNEKNS